MFCVQCSVISKRLDLFTEINSIIDKYQGFRMDHSTLGSIFALKSIVQKYITTTKGEFYCAFIDVRKSFDMVDRKKLLYILLQNGVRRKFFRIVVNMYSNIRAAVLVEHGMKITVTFVLSAT